MASHIYGMVNSGEGRYHPLRYMRLFVNDVEKIELGSIDSWGFT
jgi:hypothetical protein